MNKSALAQIWREKALAELKGRAIADIRYLEEEESEQLGWYRCGVVLVLDDGTELMPTADDEGNGPGALFTTRGNLPIIPVI